MFAVKKLATQLEYGHYNKTLSCLVSKSIELDPFFHKLRGLGVRVARSGDSLIHLNKPNKWEYRGVVPVGDPSPILRRWVELIRCR